MKKLLQEIPKGALNTLGGALGVMLLAIISKQIRSVLGLSLSDTQVSSIQFWLLVFAVSTFLFVGWFLFFRTQRKLRLVEKQLRDSLTTPRKILDDYEHLKKRGFWVHRKTGQRVCGSCLIAGIESPLSAASYQDSVGRFDRNVWICGRKDCRQEYFWQKGDV